MRFARLSLLTLGFTILLAGLVPRLCAAQSAPAPTATPTAQSQPAPDQAAAQAWVRDNAQKYRIQRFVAGDAK